MTIRFDPLSQRRRWDQWLFRFLGNKDVTAVPASAQNHFSQIVVSKIIEAYLIGYAEAVQPLLERQMAGMLSVPESNRGHFASANSGEGAWSMELYEWRQKIGLCKWLSGEAAERELAAALAADWQEGHAAVQSQNLEHRTRRCQGMSVRLGTALAADVPRLGLGMLEECKMIQPYIPLGALIGFGAWACHHLVAGGHRDREFLSRGKQALTATLLPTLLPNDNWVEIGLWIKAIFFDSGAARTAEEAMILAYECMPGVRRPDFVSARSSG